MIEPSILRILNSKGQTIGTGFLVSKTLAVTCAHVVLTAGVDGENRIRVQFTGQKQPINATVPDEFLDLDRDVAILQLESVPDGVHPLRLGLAAQCQPGNPFYSFGYTSAAKVQGIIARGAIDGYLPQHQLLQLQAPQANHGISGAPVLDEKRGVVVGMITKGHNELGRNQETTFVTPAETLFEICPEIQVVYKAGLKKKDRITSIRSRYQKYLREIAKNLQEWEKRYTPLFAKIGPLEIFAKLRTSEDSVSEHLLDLVKNNRNLVIVGTAGSGKSTTLTKIALVAAQEHKSQRDSKIPILLPLRDFNGDHLNTYLENHLKAWGITLEQIEKDLNVGKYILLFDGLNEIPKDQKNICIRLLRNFMKAYPRNRFIFASRDYHEDWLEVNGKIIPACEIQPLTEKQIEQYINRYFGIGSKYAEKLILELHEHDRETWRNPRSLVQLAKVPLLLQMLVISFEENQRIPQNEGELILKYVDLILTKWEPGREAGRYPSILKKELLGTIARKMFDSGYLWAISRRPIFETFSRRLAELKSVGDAKQEYEPLDIWDELKNNNLLIEQDDAVFFPHPLMQDLFVSLSIRSSCFSELSWEPNITEIYIRFGGQRAKWFGDPDFDSGIMMLGIVPEKYQISALCVVGSINSTLSYQAFQTLEPDYNTGLLEGFFQKLLENLLTENLDESQYENLVDTIGKFEQTSVYEYLMQIAEKCPSKIGRRNAANKIWNKHNIYGLDAIICLKSLATSDDSEEVRSTCLQLLARTENIEQSKDLLEFLVERLLTETLGLIKKLHGELNKVLNSDTAIEKLYSVSQDLSCDTEKRRKSIWILGKTNYREKSNNVLCKLALSDEMIEVRQEAVQALRYFPSHQTVKIIQSILSEHDSKLKIDATITLKSCNRFNTLPVLMIALSDLSPEVGNEAIDALYEIVNKRGVFESLVRGTKSTNPILRRRSISTLAKIAEDDRTRYSDKAARELSYHVNERDHIALLDIGWGIRKFDLQKSNEILYSLMNDPDDNIRNLARERAEILGLI